MTTSAARIDAAARRGGGNAGFTLLEIIVVMAIVSLLFAAGFVGYKLNDDERQLTDAVDSIEVMAKRARTLASLEQRPYGIEFYQGSVSLMPYADALLDPTEREMLLDERLAESGEEPTVSSSDNWAGRDDMQVSIQRWGSDEWSDVTRRDRHVWRFDPNGLCEPVAVRFEMGESWMAARFHPLTAAIDEVESDVK